MGRKFWQLGNNCRTNGMLMRVSKLSENDVERAPGTIPMNPSIQVIPSGGPESAEFRGHKFTPSAESGSRYFYLRGKGDQSQRYITHVGTSAKHKCENPQISWVDSGNGCFQETLNAHRSLRANRAGVWLRDGSNLKSQHCIELMNYRSRATKQDATTFNLHLFLICTADSKCSI